ncbi:hypothetical protein BVC93_01680 [Mycobacterium sp. MS1601]|nr:hypothetical protein BVC93_01680 [Mycobacterium sp. MS1601]
MRYRCARQRYTDLGRTVAVGASHIALSGIVLRPDSELTSGWLRSSTLLYDNGFHHLRDGDQH